MNRIENLFNKKRKSGKSALIFYLTAGYPDLMTTEALLPALEKAGADMVELGVPFSDPIADGPVIQKASSDALEKGATVKKILSIVHRFRKKSEMPIVLFGAFNPFYKFGLEKLVKECARIGADGLLVPDLPPEEAEEFISFCDDAGLCHIFLASPTTSPERSRLIVEKSTGFIYYISTRGVTGARDKLDKSILAQVKKIKSLTEKPVAVGFGISKPEHVAWLLGKADGIIVGSALIKEIGKGASVEERVQLASQFTRKLALML